jgi:copper chaperone CopZ
MKKTILVTLVIGIMTVFSGNAQKAMDKFMVQVDGLGCPFCAYGLEKKFKEFKGIKNVKIDIETGDFSFKYPAEKELTMNAVIQQVDKAGYTPITSKIERANGKIESSEDGKVTLNPEDLIEKEVFVYGNCEQCRARIENAANRINGVGGASWSEESKLLSVSFDPSIISMETIEKSVTNTGHDTKTRKAKDRVYGKLPKCCQYERTEE